MVFMISYAENVN